MRGGSREEDSDVDEAIVEEEVDAEVNAVKAVGDEGTYRCFQY